MADSAPTKSEIITRLKHALQALALRAELQLSLFPDFVCKADELALDFADWYHCATGNYPGDFTETQKRGLAELIEFLDKISGQENAHLWTDEALSSRPEWAQIRLMALSCLASLGWPLDTPPSYAHEFFRGGKSQKFGE